MPAPGRPDDDTLTCQWCGQPVPRSRATWWDGEPQCPDPIRCAERIPAKPLRPAGGRH
jgi:hypothetical protein